MTGFALVHSPLVGPGCWRGVARSLQNAGSTSLAIDYGGVGGPDWYGGAGERIAQAARTLPEPWALVAHSGAGALAPSIVAAAPRPPAAIVFVDALPPHPRRSWMQTVPSAWAARLRLLAVDGVLPPWNRWFPEDPLPRVITDPSLRAGFEADLPRVDLAWLDAVAPAFATWADVAGGFVRLSEAYGDEAAWAQDRGWRVREARMHHLAMVTQPDTVASILAEMATAMLHA